MGGRSLILWTVRARSALRAEHAEPSQQANPQWRSMPRDSRQRRRPRPGDYGVGLIARIWPWRSKPARIRAQAVAPPRTSLARSRRPLAAANRAALAAALTLARAAPAPVLLPLQAARMLAVLCLICRHLQ